MAVQNQRLRPKSKKGSNTVRFQQSSHIKALEANVLGGIIKEKDALTVVIDILKPESFQEENHIAIYQAILTLFGKTEPIDLLTVTNQLRQNGELE